ncbi:ABC transporter substrate-binding protein [Salinispira pacifica]
MERRVRNSGFTLLVAILLAALPVFGAWAAGAKESGSSQSQALTKVTLRLNWKITGPHAAYYLGKDLGYYKAEGIDLQIDEGNGSVTAAQLAANGSNDFGLADAAAVIPLVAKGLPIECVGMVSPRTSLAVIARKDSGITSLKDLEGKTLAVTAGDALTQIWPAVVAANNLDAGKIKLVYVDAAAKIPLVMEKKADALLGSSSDQNFTMEANGVPATTIDFADNGVNVLNLGLWVNKDWAKAHGDLISRFLRATQKSMNALLSDNNMEKAASLLSAAKPELEQKVALQQTKAYAAQFKSPNCPDQPLLVNCPGDWTQTLHILTTYEGLKTDLKASDLYTNQYFK